MICAGCNSLLPGVCVVLCSTAIAVPHAAEKTQPAGHHLPDPVYDTAVYRVHGLDSVHAEKRAVPAAFPGDRIVVGGVFCFGGLVLVMSLHMFPFFMTMLKNAMQNIPASLEESGAVFGAGFGRRLRGIFAPLLTGNYAIGALLVFVKTLSEYGTPCTLGRRIGFYVFTTDIHRYSTTAPIDFGRSASLSAVLVCICMAMRLMRNFITGKNSHRLVSGKGSRPAQTSLSADGRIGAWLRVIPVMLIAVGVPYFSIIAAFLIKLRGDGLTAGNFTLDHYKELLTTPKALSAIRKSLFLAVSSAIICSVIGTAVIGTARQIQRLLEESAGRCEPAARNRAGHRHHAVPERNL